MQLASAYEPMMALEESYLVIHRLQI